MDNLFPIDLLDLPRNTNRHDVDEKLKADTEKLVELLESFQIRAKVVDVKHSPIVTRYVLKLDRGVRICDITDIADDIAMYFYVEKIRIQAPIPGTTLVGIEIPNRIAETVPIRELIDSAEFRDAEGALPFVIGRDTDNQIVIGDLADLYHMLIAGTTGSGKSVCVNSVLISLLYRFAPKDLRLIVVDPKQVEMVVYNDLPHLLTPVITDPWEALDALEWAVNEMERRYSLLGKHLVRNISGYKKRMKQREETLDPSLPSLEPMPYIVIAIDELSDLMIVAGDEVEDAIMRIAQRGRAVGIHLLVATQCPSVDVITDVIRANLPSRIALAVSFSIDSNTIMDADGAEKLLGHGDMLYMPVGKAPLRVQGCYISDEEIENVVGYITANS